MLLIWHLSFLPGSTTIFLTFSLLTLPSVDCALTYLVSCSLLFFIWHILHYIPYLPSSDIFFRGITYLQSIHLIYVALICSVLIVLTWHQWCIPSLPNTNAALFSQHLCCVSNLPGTYIYCIIYLGTHAANLVIWYSCIYLADPRLHAFTYLTSAHALLN